MHNTRLSIFILPVLIIGLSIFTTFVEENETFRSLFSISQVANPFVNENGEEILQESENSAEQAEEIISEELPASTEASPEETADDATASDTAEAQAEVAQTEQAEQASKQEESINDTENTNTTPPTEEGTSQAPQEQETPVVTETPAEEPVKEEVPAQDAELFAAKLAQFESSKANISFRFEQNISRLKDARNQLAEKITAMEAEGKDTSQATEALSNLDAAIKNSQRYLRDKTQPESIPGIQRVLVDYISNVRTSLQEGYTALFSASMESE